MFLILLILMCRIVTPVPWEKAKSDQEQERFLAEYCRRR